MSQDTKNSKGSIKESEKNIKNTDKNKLQSINTFKFNIFEYFTSIFCRFGVFKQKKAIFDYSIQQLNKFIDLQQIINKLNEIDKLKIILLNNDQLKLFNYLPKPSICYQLEKGKVIFHDKLSQIIPKKDKDEDGNIQEAITSYQRLQKEEKKINFRLIQNLDEKYKSLFQLKMKDNQLLHQPEKPIQENQTELNKQHVHYFSKQNSKTSISNDKEFFVNVDQDQIDIQDNILKYSVFGQSPRFNQIISSEIQTKQTDLEKICD